VTDRIELWWTATDDTTAAAMRDNEALVAGEVLAVCVTADRPNAPLAPHDVEDLGLTFWLRVVD